MINLKKYFANYWLVGIQIVILLVSVGCTGDAEVNIIPQPVEMTVKNGVFKLTGDTVIVAEEQAYTLAEQLTQTLEPATGYTLNVTKEKPDVKNTIILRLNPNLHKLGDEGYKLEVTPHQVVLEAPKQAGIFYGIQTIRQLLPVEIYGKEKAEGVKWQMVISIKNIAMVGNCGNLAI